MDEEALGVVDSQSAKADVVTVSPVSMGHAIRGRRVFLRPLTPYDTHHIYEWALHPEALNRWRLAGHMPTREQFAEFLTRPDEVSVAIDDDRTGKTAGLGQCYNIDLQHGRASLAVLADRSYHGTLALGEAHRLLVRYAFDVLPINKLCAEVPAFNWPSLLTKDGSMRGWEKEGVLKNHVFRGGRWWDVALFAKFRPDI